ncbi:hypothetical protein FHR72_000403 [Mycolicibacterium iranicum]|uniref:ESX-1 secretion-associated protein n=1 Tax=Mycolicibacterium iranicum TaxID=912594 RepID=A0A839Q3X8_MYCIR|nr:type VII secretion target [Mycolicibacterium iranicum]MBB2988946.1 hypothetical protein [Mycolicibacterium iranicum]
MTQALQVDTGELRRAGSSFTSAGDSLAAMQADAPLSDAAAAVPQLQTAAACNAAKATVAQEMSSLASAAREYGGNLISSAEEYDATDQASGSNVAGVDIPPPAPR